MSRDRLAVRLLVGLGRAGWRGEVRPRVLSALVTWAADYGVGAVVEWCVSDSGWLAMPSAPWSDRTVYWLTGGGPAWREFGGVPDPAWIRRVAFLDSLGDSEGVSYG